MQEKFEQNCPQPQQSYIHFNRPVVLSEQVWNLLKHEEIFQLHYLSMKQYPHSMQKLIGEVEQFFGQVSSWNVQSLLVQGHYNNTFKFPSLFRSIQNIQFHQLKQVNVWKCSIDSIEAITNCSFPCLQDLWLDDNHICSVKSLLKTSFPNLKKLSLRGNFVDNLAIFTAVMLPQLQILILEYWKQDPVVGEDIRWLAKLECPNLEQVQLDSVGRIVQRNALETIMKKHKNTKLFLKSQGE